LDEVYRFVGSGRATQRGQNVMLYRGGDPVVEVEVGVQVAGTFLGDHQVVCSSLPGGTAAVVVHRGSYHALNGAHQAVQSWCADNGYETTGVRWEVYGDWSDDPEQLTTEVWYQLRG